MFSRKAFILLLLGTVTWLALLSSPAYASPIPSPALPPTRGASPGRGPSTPVSAPPAKKPKQKPEPKPDLPKSKAELKKRYFKGAPKKDKSCFFTGVDLGDTKATDVKLRANTAAAKSQCRKAGLKILEDIWSKNNILMRGEYTISPTDNFKMFTVWVSEVFAEESSGTAYLLLQDNLKPRRDSIFYGHEYPAMKAGGKVSKIMQANFDGNAATKPTLPADSDATRTWWKKGDADPAPR